MKKILFPLFLLPVLAFNQNTDSLFIKRMSDEIMVNGKAYENLWYLTKKIGNRVTASPNNYKAEVWGRNLLESYGAEKVFTQPCKVVHWIRGKNDEVVISSINKTKQNIKLQSTALGNSLAGKVKAAVLLLKNYDELEKRKDEVKGKIVFFNNAFNQTYVDPFQAYGECGTYRYLGPSKAAKYGAVACVIRSLGGGTDNFAHTGMMKYNDSFPKIPCAALGLQDADFLNKLIEKENKKIELSIVTNGIFLKDTIANNIIGEIKGSTFPNEIITIGGHLDSWDVGEGAHDDGAGIVQTIEVLRVLKLFNYIPKHTIRFVLFANEENGLEGGKTYANEAVAKNEKHIFALETDAGGFTPQGFSIKANDAVIEKLQPFIKILQPYHCFFIKKGGGGADIGALYDKLNTPICELLPDGQRYFDVHHTNNDVFEMVNKRELHLGAVNIAALIYLIDKYGL